MTGGASAARRRKSSVELRGHAAGVPIPRTLAHGAGGNHAAWFQQIPAFARHRRVIAWDQRGFGRSSARGGATSPERAVRDLAAVLAAAGAAGPVDLVGQSMGGWAVLGFALAEPARVRRLVLADPAESTPPSFARSGPPSGAADSAGTRRCPVLLVVGERNALFPPALLRTCAALLPDARLVVIPRSGHSPYFEEPEAWNRAVAEFLGIALEAP